MVRFGPWRLYGPCHLGLVLYASQGAWLQEDEARVGVLEFWSHLEVSSGERLMA